MRVLVNGDRLLDHMMVATYLRCWNYYFFKYVLGLSDPEFAEALVFGIMFHSALDAWYTTGVVEMAEQAFIREGEKYEYIKYCGNALKDHPHSISNGLEKLRLYCDIYGNDYFKPVESEVEHFIKMEAGRIYGEFHNKNSNKNNICAVKSTPVYYVGHIDCVGKVNNNMFFLEHKTTALYPTSPLLEAYTFGLQVKGYTLCMMDKYKLKEPCHGCVDIIYLRAKKREDSTLRYPLMFDIRQINNFKKVLSYIIGEILWKEQLLRDWSLPDPGRCTAYSRICEYKEACDLLPNMKLCYKFLTDRGFKPTMPARLDRIQKDTGNKISGHLYYKVEGGPSV